MKKSSKMNRTQSLNYSVNVPLRDMRGDSVILAEFEDGELGKEAMNDIKKDGYKHPYVHCACAQLPGAKDQDRLEIYQSTDGKSPYYFGVFDGHGLSAAASDMCAKDLRQMIMDNEAELTSQEEDSSDSQAEVDDENYTVPSDLAITRAFHEMDEKIKSLKDETPRTGTCAVVLMIGKSRREDSSRNNGEYDSVAKIAWAGDSRCIMIDEHHNAIELSEDHRVDTNLSEQKRIQETVEKAEPRPGLVESQWWKDQEATAKANGKARELRRKSFLGLRRHNGPKVLYSFTGGISLQISRSLGDVMAARSAIATPEIKTLTQEGGFSKMRFVLASDGVWDVLTSDAVAKFLKKYADPTEAATRLCAFAKAKRLYKGMYPDDITAIVVDVASDLEGIDTLPRASISTKKNCKVM